MLAFSSSCERNKEPILTQLRIYLAAAHHVLEVGSGTGQHAEYFAAALPHLLWQATEEARALPALAARIQAAALPNLPPPFALDVTQAPWPGSPVDAVVTANTLHIIHWPAVQSCLAGVAGHLRPGGLFLCYGPFLRHGRHTSPSNALFDRDLKDVDPGRGIRDIDDLVRVGAPLGLRLHADIGLPANNQLLVWRLATAESG